MTDYELIEHIIILKDGVEYNSNDIFNDKELHSFVFKNRLALPNSLLNDIQSENGTIHITYNSFEEKTSVTLKNVSPQLYDLFCQRYK